MVDSSLMFNERRAYTVTKTVERVVLKEADTGNVVLQLEVGAPGVVSCSRAEFHTMKGRLFEVSAKEWKIEKQMKAGQIVDAKGGAVSIG